MHKILLNKNVIGVTLILMFLIFFGFLFKTDLMFLFNKYPSLFIVLVFISELLFLPRITVLVAAGLLFSPTKGAMLSISGDLAAAGLVWYLGKLGFSSVFSSLISSKNSDKVLKLLKQTKNNSGFLIALLRIAPFAHYSATSLIAGTLNLNFTKYIIGTFVGLLPTAFLYPYLSNQALGGKYFVSLFILIVVIMVVILSGMYVNSKFNRDKLEE